MSCLNLPVEIRCQAENMYPAGIVPSPTEPHLTDLNHYLRPLIDDMVVVWDNGIRFSKTPKYPDGRNCHGAIAAVVCDLPAAHKAAGMGGHNHQFYCSVCKCSGGRTRGRADYENWEMRDPEEMRRQAEAWRDAATTLEQDRIFKAHGICWSELWRLSYWNPTRQLVVDSMHCILEGLGQQHARVALGLTTASANEQDLIVPSFTYKFRVANADNDSMKENEVKQVSQIHALLVMPVAGVGGQAEIEDDPEADGAESEDEGEDSSDEVEENLEKLATKLAMKNLRPLKFVCDDLGLNVQQYANRRTASRLIVIIQKKDYAIALVDWVSTMSSITLSIC
jgi:hypothetical protein